jgi:SAM-dependent methyltransferase
MTEWAASLRCPDCRRPDSLVAEADGLRCPACSRSFPIRDGAVHFHDKNLGHFEARKEGHSDDLITALKLKIKGWPPLFEFLYWASGAFVGVRAGEAVRDLPKDALVVNLGSGVKRIRAGVLNLDYYAFPDVQIVADATNLPFRDGTVDAVICESLLEHVEDPAAVAREISRVVKKGGLAYVLTPFMLGYHSSPEDYARWTMYGLRGLMKDFDETNGGVAFGPTVAFNHILSSWLALPLSLGSARLHQVLAAGMNAVLAPLSLLDWVLVKHPSSQDIAHAIYFMGRKR